MQFQDSNFFATELPHSNRYSISHNQDSLSADHSLKKNPKIRIREAKTEMKKINKIYNQTLQEYLKTKNSLQQTNHRTHQLRNDFLKLYGNKKHKFVNKSLMERRKQEEEDFLREASTRTRSMKMNNDLGVLYTRNESEAHNQRVKEQNRRKDDIFRKTLRLKRREEQEQARERYMEVKKGETEFLIRKKNMSAMVNTRARHNYLLKVGKEMEMLESYTKLLQKTEYLDLRNTREFDAQSFNKTFFVTTKNTFRE